VATFWRVLYIDGQTDSVDRIIAHFTTLLSS